VRWASGLYDLDFIDHLHHAGHALAAVQAELLVVKGGDFAAHGHHAVADIDPDPPQAGDVALVEKIDNATPKIVVVLARKQGRHSETTPFKRGKKQRHAIIAIGAPQGGK
jgi:chemotaxis response regulator CheB